MTEPTGFLPQRIDSDAPVFVISVAAQLADMHPQTLRGYDRLGLVVPKRARGRGRRYSLRDIATLRHIQHLSQNEGINLEGIRRILALEDELEAADVEGEPGVGAAHRGDLERAGGQVGDRDRARGRVADEDRAEVDARRIDLDEAHDGLAGEREDRRRQVRVGEGEGDHAAVPAELVGLVEHVGLGHLARHERADDHVDGEAVGIRARDDRPLQVDRPRADVGDADLDLVDDGVLVEHAEIDLRRRDRDRVGDARPRELHRRLGLARIVAGDAEGRLLQPVGGGLEDIGDERRLARLDGDGELRRHHRRRELVHVAAHERQAHDLQRRVAVVGDDDLASRRSTTDQLRSEVDDIAGERDHRHHRVRRWRRAPRDETGAQEKRGGERDQANRSHLATVQKKLSILNNLPRQGVWVRVAPHTTHRGGNAGGVRISV